MSCDIGMPTLAGLETLADNARLCADLALSFVELNMNLPCCRLDALNAEMLRNMSAEYGIYFTLHLDENINPCDFNKAIAFAYRETLLRSVMIAQKVNIPVLNMHMNPGVCFKLPDQKLYLYARYRDHYLGMLKEFRDACTQAVGGSGIQICIENCDGYTAHEREGVELLLESDAFALTLDIGHAHLAGYSDEPLIDRYIDRLAHMHIHDANDQTCHLPLGAGGVDLRAALALSAKRGCRRVVEVKAPRELAVSVEYLRKIEEGANGDA